MSIRMRLRSELAPIKYFGLRRFCNVCDCRLRAFIPLEEIADGKFTSPIFIGETPHSVDGFETLNVNEFMCPICGSQDKARLYALFMSGNETIHRGGLGQALLHFAPEGGLEAWIRKRFPNLHYVTCDLHREDVELKLDVTNMNKLADASFDYFIFSHVLEHVGDERQALIELRRILKPGGWGIIMVPILLTITATYSDPSITDSAGRARHFGLEDHLRVHSRPDFLKLLQAAGFGVSEHNVFDWGTVQTDRLGISRGSILYVVRRS